jgi:hypothetical protein
MAQHPAGFRVVASGALRSQDVSRHPLRPVAWLAAEPSEAGQRESSPGVVQAQAQRQLRRGASAPPSRADASHELWVAEIRAMPRRLVALPPLALRLWGEDGETECRESPAPVPLVRPEVR